MSTKQTPSRKGGIAVTSRVKRLRSGYMRNYRARKKAELSQKTNEIQTFVKNVPHADYGLILAEILANQATIMSEIGALKTAFSTTQKEPVSEALQPLPWFRPPVPHKPYDPIAEAEELRLGGKK